MPKKRQSKSNNTDEKKHRWRFRGMFGGKRGKAIGFGAIAAPIAGLIANDLRKADGVIRGVIVPTVARLLPERLGGKRKLDISDKAEVIDHDK
jgi:hypothetical protein